MTHPSGHARLRHCCPWARCFRRTGCCRADELSSAEEPGLEYRTVSSVGRSTTMRRSAHRRTSGARARHARGRTRHGADVRNSQPGDGACSVTKTEFTTCCFEALRPAMSTVAAVSRHRQCGGAVGRSRTRPWPTEPMPRLMGGTKGSHIIVGSFDGAPTDSAIYMEAQVRRTPDLSSCRGTGQYLIGTTDIRNRGRSSAMRVPAMKKSNICSSKPIAMFPNARTSSERTYIHFTYSRAYRPLPYQEKGSRVGDYSSSHHQEAYWPRRAGLVSIIGGKLTTYRSLAEQAVDRVARS